MPGTISEIEIARDGGLKYIRQHPSGSSLTGSWSKAALLHNGHRRSEVMAWFNAHPLEVHDELLRPFYEAQAGSRSTWVVD